jgi:PEP-CTERM motif
MIKTLTSAAAALLLAGAAHATTVVVDAQADAIGTAGATTTLTAGETFDITASPLDLWSAGTGLRVSNANGLTGPIFAVAGDDSGQPVGTQIGQDFGTWTDATSGSTFAFGELVGSIDGGAYFAVGTNFTGTTATGGTLSLIYWDSFYGDNFGTIAATVTAVPEPASLALMLAGLGIVGGLARRRANRG